MAEAPATRPSLLVRVRDARDGPAWAQFVEIYAPLIYGFARKKGLQDADAADLTQEVLRAVAAAMPRLEYDPQRGSFRGWLFTIVRNKLKTFMQRQQGQVQGRGDTATVALLQQQPAEEESDWDSDYERRLLAWAAAQIKPTVSETVWQAFWQTAVEGKSGKDVARELEMTVAAVYMAKSRILARIKEIITEVQGENDHV